MRYRSGSFVVALTVLLSTTAGAASGPAGTINDQAGDANGVNGVWYSAAMLGYITEEVRNLVFQGDPAGEGIVTPGSYGPGDLREVRFETEYESVPVGEDGLDHRATALRIVFRTEEPPAAPLGTGRLELEVIAWMQGPATKPCRTSFALSVFEDGTVTGPGWYRFEDCVGGLATPTDPRWTGTVAGSEVTLRIPFDAIDEIGALYLQEGGILRGPHASTQLRGLNTLDVTRVGADVVLGSDMPEDVPCTKGCPAG
ncbi:MAG TPA: hypothetical protein VGB28_08635 [Actinomycetota bacterium]|jgi:hypothetical protein